MKITLFTTDKKRANYFINFISKICTNLYVVQEHGFKIPGKSTEQSNYPNIIKKYFDNVYAAEKRIFGNPVLKKKEKKIKILSIKLGELSNLPLNHFQDFWKSDYYIVFGSSYIKGELVDFLIKKKAINIHMGVSPYYRGTSCNFWALYDGNAHLVGSTVHMLSKGLDSGPILYHAMSNINIKANPFEYTMSTVKSAFHSITKKIEEGSIFEIVPVLQNKNDEIRYSRKAEFGENTVKNYFSKKINLKNIKFKYSLLKDPFFLDTY